LVGDVFVSFAIHHRVGVARGQESGLYSGSSGPTRSGYCKRL
jgi:hypothetical protein